MAGVGEASAIVNLIAIAPQLSKAVIEAASNYKHARTQIESFGREVCMLGEILGQLRDVLFTDNKSHLEQGVKALLSQILDECSGMFSQLNSFSDRLHAKPNALRSVNRRGKVQWVLGDKTELEYLRARVDSMKINILLMMTLQSVHNHKSSDAKSEENAQDIMKLSQKNEACIKRLQMLENEGAHVEEHVRGKISSNMSVVSSETVGTVGSVQSNSTWNSIFRAYGWEIQKDEELPADNAKPCFRAVKERAVEERVVEERVVEEEELCGMGDYVLLQFRDHKVEDGQLEKLGLVPSTLDGDTKVPEWLAEDSLPLCFTSHLRHQSDGEAEKKEEMEEAETIIQKLSQNTFFSNLVSQTNFRSPFKPENHHAQPPH